MAVSHKRILIVGDPMLDRQWVCHDPFISPEAPILSWKTDEPVFFPGGTANVLACVLGLIDFDTEITFATPLTPREIKVLSRYYPEGVELKGGMVSRGPATIKNRLILGEDYRHIVRWDQDYSTLSEGDEERIVRAIRARHFDVALASDYSLGGITPNILEAARNSSDVLLIDPKGLTLEEYSNAEADVITPNSSEAKALTPSYIKSPRERAKFIGQEIPVVLLKQGGDKCLFLDRSGPEKIFLELDIPEREVIDPMGAGDVFISSLAISLLEGCSYLEGTRIAINLASWSVTKSGCARPSREQLNELL